MERGGIGRYLVALALLIPIYFLLLALIEFEYTTNQLRDKWRQFRKRLRKSVKRDTEQLPEFDEPEDSDVVVR